MNKIPIKICFISLAAYPLFNIKHKALFGGSETQVFQFANKLAQDKNYFVHFVVADCRQQHSETYGKIKVHKIFPFFKNKLKWVFSLLFLLKFYKILKAINSDIYIVRAAGIETGLVAMFCKIFQKKFIYMTASSIDVDGGYRRMHSIFGLIYEYGLKKADIVISQNFDQKKMLRRKYHKNSIVLRNSFPISKDIPDIKKKKNILWVGSSQMLKQPAIFLELAKSFPEEKFLMIMPKNNLKLWYEIKEKTQKIKNLKFIEQISFDKINKYYRDAKIFVNTSTFEGFPNTFVQAMMNATPILSLNVNPDNFINQYQCGAFAHGNVKFLKEKMFFLLKNKKIWHKLSTNALRFSQKNHDIEKNSHKFKNIISQLDQPCQTAPYKSMKDWIFRYKWLITASCFFLLFQFLISYLLWHRQGDIPPGFGDGLGYIFGIESTIKYHTLFAPIYYLSFAGHLSYIGYNFIMGLLGIFFHLSGLQVFHLSFYFGKIVLLFAIIYLLISLFKNERRLIFFSLVILALFIGDGATHGFFWVVPSFWALVIFFLLFAIIFNPKEYSPILLFLLAFLYISFHPLSTYSIIIFAIFTILSFIWNRTIFGRALKITLILIVAAIAFNGISYFLIKHYSPGYNTKIFAEAGNPNDQTRSQLSTSTSLGTIQNYPRSYTNVVAQQNKITDPAPSISLKFFNKIIEKEAVFINNYLPSFINSWNSYYSFFFNFPILLFIIIYSLISSLANKRINLVLLFFSCLIFSVISMRSSYGERSIIFLFPITIILSACGIYDFYYSFKDKFKMKIYQKAFSIVYFSLIFCGLALFAAYSLVTIIYYSKIDDYKSGSETCINFIKNSKINTTNIYITSINGINYFLSHGIENYRIAGANFYSESIANEKNIIITENPDKISLDKTDAPLLTTDKLKDILADPKHNWARTDCGIFILYDSNPR